MTNDLRRSEIHALLDAGLKRSDVASRLGVSLSLVNYYAGSRSAERLNAALRSPDLDPLPDSLPEEDLPGETDPGVLNSDREKTLSTLRELRDSAGSPSDRIKASEALLRHGQTTSDDWSPAEGDLRSFLADLRRLRPEVF